MFLLVTVINDTMAVRMSSILFSSKCTMDVGIKRLFCSYTVGTSVVDKAKPKPDQRPQMPHVIVQTAENGWASFCRP